MKFCKNWHFVIIVSLGYIDKNEQTFYQWFTIISGLMILNNNKWMIWCCYSHIFTQLIKYWKTCLNHDLMYKILQHISRPTLWYMQKVFWDWCYAHDQCIIAWNLIILSLTLYKARKKQNTVMKYAPKPYFHSL